MKKRARQCEFSEEVLLVGNPNTGKTSLFNTLTGANEHVGNWHGVTVEEKAQVFDCLGTKMRLVDLPGIYSLSALSYEEQVAIDYILSHPNCKIINICDLNNLQRNLSLTLGLMELGARVILVVNKMDSHPLNIVDYAGLERELKIKVVEVCANKKKSLLELKKALLESVPPAKIPPYVKNLVGDENAFEQIKLLECDEKVMKKRGVSIPENARQLVTKVAKKRYEYISSLQKRFFTSQGRVYGKSKLDKIVLNRFLAFPIFLLVLACVFYLTFFLIGKYLSDGLNLLMEISIGKWTREACVALFGSSSWVTHLFCDAIIGGVGTILAFLPQVALLFLFLSILEDSGYLSRVAFASEDIFGKLGLSGKSIYTLLMGFGCSTTAILTARNMEDKNSKIKTALVTPYMSCSAKFPIYAVIGGAFFGANNIFVIMGLYLLGLAVALGMSYVMEKTVLKSKQQSFILEFPPYRFGGFKRTAKVLWENVKQFLVRVGSVILSMNVIVWVLSSFSFDFSFVLESGKMSMLEGFGRVIAPLFIPLGFGSFGPSCALIAGVIAKEVIIASIAMFNGVANGESVAASLSNPASPVSFASPAAALSFLVFSLLYCPCISSMAVLGKEVGKKWTAIGIGVQFVIAYLCSLFVFNVFGAVERWGVWAVLGVLAALIAILISVIKVAGVIKSRKGCHGCKGCK